MESKPRVKRGKPRFVFTPPAEAPVFRPTLDEWLNPLEYINKIRPYASKIGICRIIPPSVWKSPFVLDMNKLRFTPRIQRINELEARTRIKLNFNDQLTKHFASMGKTFQVPVMEKIPLDLYTLHRIIRDIGGVDVANKEKKWGEVALKMGFTGKLAGTALKNHYDNLIHPFLMAVLAKEAEIKDDFIVVLEDDPKPDDSLGKNPTMRELKSLRFLGAGPKMAVCDGGAMSKGLRTRGKKIMYEFDPLAKYLCQGCRKGDLEETLVSCVSCEDRYHCSCLIPALSIESPPDNWRCPKCVAADGYKPLEDFGFSQAEREYTLKEFEAMANDFKRNYFKMEPDQVPTKDVEEEFWRVVSSTEEAVTVEYGADLHVIEHGSAFPRKNQPCAPGVDPKIFEKYSKSAWNLNNLPVLKNSVLRHISADISGMKIPWMYAGMCFATFCWHNEDHWSYSINYLHLGEPKTWYGVPGHFAEQFEEAMRNEAPELFAAQPDLLHHLVTIMNPNDIAAAGVPVYRTDQHKGEFVITFPRAYHAGFNQGFNFAEACNFAPSDWLVIGRECISNYAKLGRNNVFSHDELICKMAFNFEDLDRNIALELVKDMTVMVESERKRRCSALEKGITKTICVRFDNLPDDERQCCSCNTTLFLSAVSCSCNRNRLVCLDHIDNLCKCKTKNYLLRYQYQLDKLQHMVIIIRNKLYEFDSWKNKIESALGGKNPAKVSLKSLTELLVEGKQKEVPRSDILDLLEYHVRRGIECSGLARTILGGATEKAPERKISLDDLKMFIKEVENLPCTINEQGSIAELLEKAERFKRNAARALRKNFEVKTRVTTLIRKGKAMNIEFPEVDLLENKLKQQDWVGEVVRALESNAKVEVIQQLLDTAETLPRNRQVDIRKQALLKYRSTLKPRTPPKRNILADAMSTTPPQVAIVEIENTPPTSPRSLSPESSLLFEGNDVTQRKDALKLKMEKVFKGETVLYLKDLDDLVVDAKLSSMPLPLIQELEEGVAQARDWVGATTLIFNKRFTQISLMEVLWPRKFLMRCELLFEKDKTKENLIQPDDQDFSYAAFKKAWKIQESSLNLIRSENLRSNIDQVTCLCGEIGGEPYDTCELCLTHFHEECFSKFEYSIRPRLYSFKKRNLCTYCARTNRPSIDDVTRQADAAKNLPIKIPECLALGYLCKKLDKWQKEAAELLKGEEVTGCLQELVSYIIDYRYKMDGKLADTTTLPPPPKNAIKPIANSILLQLQQCITAGSILEVSTDELYQIYMITDLGLTTFLLDDATMPELPLAMQKSRRAKFTRKPSNPALKKLLAEPLLTDPPKAIVKKRRRRSSSKLVFPKRKKIIPAKMLVRAGEEQHEPESNCASPNCLLPVDYEVDWVKCDAQCGQWFHMKCVDLTKSSITEEDPYICSNCVCSRVCDQVTEGLSTIPPVDSSSPADIVLDETT